MAETKNHEEPAFPAKRKPDLSCGDAADFPKKTQKLGEVAAEESPQNPQDSDKNSPAADEPKDEVEANAGPEVEDEEEDDQEDYAEDESEDEESNGKAEVVDRKGKGILRQDKGKGKMVEEDEDDDSDDDSSDGGSELEDGDSDLSDDPLAEVDLDNILPSRTRRRQVQPGVYIANDAANNDQDDDSDDPDAL